MVDLRTDQRLVGHRGTTRKKNNKEGNLGQNKFGLLAKTNHLFSNHIRLQTRNYSMMVSLHMMQIEYL